jgi:hypothetical protein
MAVCGLVRGFDLEDVSHEPGVDGIHRTNRHLLRGTEVLHVQRLTATIRQHTSAYVSIGMEVVHVQGLTARKLTSRP